MHNAICEQGEGRTDPISTHLISSFVLGRMSRFVFNALVTKALQFFLNHHISSARSERKKTIALSRYLPYSRPDLVDALIKSCNLYSVVIFYSFDKRRLREGLSRDKG